MILINLENGLIKCIGTWDRMSSSGQETLDKIADKLGLETSKELETRVADQIEGMDINGGLKKWLEK